MVNRYYQPTRKRVYVPQGTDISKIHGRGVDIYVTGNPSSSSSSNSGDMYILGITFLILVGLGVLGYLFREDIKNFINGLKK